MPAFWQAVASNALLVVFLAAGVALLGRFWKNPWCLHLLWLLVLVKLITPPLVVVPLPWFARLAGPAAEARVLPPPTNATTPVAPIIDPELVNYAPVERVRPADAPVEATPAEIAAAPDPVDVTAEGPTAGVPSAALAASARHGFPWLALLGGAWALGTLGIVALYARRIVRFRRLLRSAELPAADVLAMTEALARRLRLRRIPRVRMLPVCISPLVWAFGGRAEIFLPTALFERLDAAARESLLAHELAHVRRGDPWVRRLEVVVIALCWWHPVAWWAARRLRDLEDECCDIVVADLAPHAVPRYAAALVDTLDFLCEGAAGLRHGQLPRGASVLGTIPFGATAAQSSAALGRRILMLKHHAHRGRLTFGRVVLVVAIAAAPMALACGEKPAEKDVSTAKADAPIAEPHNAAAISATEALPAPSEAHAELPSPPIAHRTINKRVQDFPEKPDLSTPEGAAAAWNRASGADDDEAVLALSWIQWGPREIEQARQARRAHPTDAESFSRAQRDAEIVEVAIYRDDLANVVTRLAFNPGEGRNPYSSRSFGRIDGVWKNLGEGRFPSLAAARQDFERKKDNVWRTFTQVRDNERAGRGNRVDSGSTVDRGAPVAPGQPLGISVEKADLMGRIDWAMMHGMRDIVARRSLEWGDVQKDAAGHRTIRYKFEATMRDGQSGLMNLKFTFDDAGNILTWENVEGYPQWKADKSANVNSPEGMRALVEDFFQHNFRDITARETIDWGDVVKAEDGSRSIRYKYRVPIWKYYVQIRNQVFTFAADGKFISVKNVEGYPKMEDEWATTPAAGTTRLSAVDAKGQPIAGGGVRIENGDAALTAASITLNPSTAASESIRREALRYDGKDFNQWRNELQTELNPARRTEGIKAMRVFAQNGYGREAAEAIVQLMRAYPVWPTGDSPLGQLKAAAWSAFGATLFPKRTGDAVDVIDPKDSVPVLLAELREGNDNSKGFAAVVLSRLEDVPDAQSVAAKLHELAAREKVEDIRSQIQIAAAMVVALSDDQGDATAALMRKAIADRDISTYWRVVAALRQRPGRLTIRDGLSIQLSAQGKAILPVLIEAITAGGDYRSHGIELFNLDDFYRAAVPLVIAGLENAKSDDERAPYVLALQNMGSLAISAMGESLEKAPSDEEKIRYAEILLGMGEAAGRNPVLKTSDVDALKKFVEGLPTSPKKTELENRLRQLQGLALVE